MSKFIINMLSANGQCHSISEATLVFENLVNSISHVWPVINGNRAFLYYEHCNNTISLLNNENFEATISKTRDGNLRKLWFLYTRKKYILRSTEVAEIEIVAISPHIASVTKGRAIHELMTNDVIWMSFGGNPFHEAKRYQVQINGSATIEVMNAHNEKSIQELLPFFEHSDKHHEKPYYDHERKVTVAAMPIRNRRDAGNLLRIGIKHGNDIFSYHKARNEFYRFLLTGGNIYHGFMVEKNEVPIPLHAQLVI